MRFLEARRLDQKKKAMASGKLKNAKGDSKRLTDGREHWVTDEEHKKLGESTGEYPFGNCPNTNR